TCALEAVDWLNARTPTVAQALAASSGPSVLPRAQGLLRTVQGGPPANGEGTGPHPARWDAVRDDASLAPLLGAIWRFGWRSAIEHGLQVADPARGEIATEAYSGDLRDTWERLLDL